MPVQDRAFDSSPKETSTRHPSPFRKTRVKATIMADDPSEEKTKEVVPLDEGDIALLKTYVRF